MLSGLKPVLCSAVFLLVLSTLLAAPISFLMNKWLLSIFSVADESSQQLPGAYLKGTLRNKGRRWSVFVAAGVFVLWLVRPSEPYNHISNAIPFALLSAVLPSHADAEVETIPFPLPNLLTEEYWEPAHGHYKGWAPKMGESDGYAENVPKWASDELPDGFDRWIKAWQDKHWSQGTSTNISDEAEDEEGGEGDVDESEDVQTYYNPVVDPLRINNLDGGILDPLQKALKERDIPITHVVLVLMESARKDIFPFKSGSFLHDKILGSYEHKKPDNFDDLDAKLSRMTPVAEMLTGESTGFGDHELPEDLWRDPSDPDMGGINVNGMLTGSTLSFKSALVNYCGVGPLPVDFMMEAEAAIYQPCIMQVLNLFNQLKEKTGTSPSHDNSTRATLEDIRKRKWTSTFTQSITELYDKQNILNRHMGFDNSICREQISNSRAKHHHPGMTEINYFGYPEVEVYPYIKDVIEETVKSNKRLFLSHFTSTTHHPWNTPSGFHDETYFEDDILGSHDDMDKYLNTVRYVDQWLGKFMGLLDETGIANETLVVFVGDQ